MLEILAVPSKDTQREICEKCNVEYKCEALAYAAYVDEELVGVAQFGIKGQNGYLYDLEKAPGTDDEEALFIMGRALLNFLDLAGVHDAYIDDSANIDRKRSARVGFFPNDEGKLYMNLRGIFTPHH